MNNSYIYFFVAVTSFLILYHKEKLEILLEKYKFTHKLILLFSLVFSFYLWGSNLKADWGLTDDHMIMHYFIDNPKVSLFEVPQIIMEKTEVGKFGNTTINRPFYYTGRVIESALWQRDVSLWYLARIAMFFIAFSLFWILIERWLGFFYGGIVMFAVLLPSYWAWIWGYLGPAENYAMFGSSLYVYGFFSILSQLTNKKVDKKRVFTSSLVLLLGSLVAIGSKENFLILIIPLIYIVFLLFKNKVKSCPLTISLAVIFIYSAFIATGIYLGLTKAGGDVYGQSIGILDRLQMTYSNLLVTFKKINIFGILAIILFGLVTMFITKNNGHLDRYRAIIKKFFLASSVIILLYSSQVFFYNNSFPPSSLRYSFPGMLAIPLFGILALTTLFPILEITGFSKFIIKQTKNAIFTALLIIIAIDGYQETKAFVRDNVTTTNAFSTTMKSFYSYLENNREEPIVFDSYSVWNVEPIASVRAYLLANNIKNPMFLRLNFTPVTESSNAPVASKIYYFLNHISNNGGCGFTGAEYSFLSGGDCDQWGFQPIAKLNGDYSTIKIDEQNRISGSVESN